MGQMLVRNLDDAVIERLKQKALDRGTSLEQVARDVLTEAAQVDDRVAWAVRADALRALTQRDPASDTVAVIRAWRESDPLAGARAHWGGRQAATKATEA